ncbi:MAG: hypothetical protein GXY65_02230 [Rhodococcus sp.]|uniref:hypothetical protein n=1 Tax=Rhodococcus sp. TaxID=1831 RepID=UPI001696ED5F|nr:hypothetical protein [Rhodococcus sp. (in: high G+C Gram-positive bacteria)]NLV78161.1 hypothetical protein [Rhodococcus sp. (in: high G+C Gram-positive bacteria)]
MTARVARGGVAAAMALGMLMSAGSVGAAPLSVSPDGFTTRCTPTAPDSDALSGLVWAGDVAYAIGDRGNDDRLAVLDTATCTVNRWIELDGTIDVEDLALDGNGTVWAAGTDDNDSRRDTVALIGIDPDSGAQTRLTLRFPDGPHEVEAVALTPRGVPVLVGKVGDGTAAVYTADGEVAVDAVADGATIDLVEAGPVRASAMDGTTRPITGAAVSADGTIAALRTKKDVYLFAVHDGDAAGAFTSAPVVVIEAPEQPQGEAVTFTEDNALLLASESAGEPTPPILELRGAADLVARGGATATASPDPGVAVAVVLLAVVVGCSGGWALLRRVRA